MSNKIDPIVIGAETLSQGAAYIKDYLGVDMPPYVIEWHNYSHEKKN